MAERMPAYEPGPRPIAMRSISAGVIWAACRARSIRTIPLDPRGLSSVALPMTRKSGVVSATATERRCDENSSARIFIGDDALGFGGDAQGEDAQIFRNVD